MAPLSLTAAVSLVILVLKCSYCWVSDDISIVLYKTETTAHRDHLCCFFLHLFVLYSYFGTYRIFRAIRRTLNPPATSKNDRAPHNPERPIHKSTRVSQTSVNYKAAPCAAHANTHGATSDRTAKNTHRHTHQSTPSRNRTEERTEKASPMCHF
ncbi:hypothetical protein NL108_015134 [Boleophthalmus pectinirostris]|nr:hypothetical protein NL108_015134 [Boleophthalmus pectinirostris]